MVSVADLKSALSAMIDFVQASDLGNEALVKYRAFNARFSELHRSYRAERNLPVSQSDEFDLVRNDVVNAFQFKDKSFLDEARARLAVIS